MPSSSLHSSMLLHSWLIVGPTPSAVPPVPPVPPLPPEPSSVVQG
jgi:hypothetical protein